MAIVYPSIEQIRHFIPAPELGELALIEFLAAHLDDDCEVFFQPMLDGDRPDVVILRQGRGAVIIEVKDWDLTSYAMTAHNRCQLRNNGAELLSPLSQVQLYKDHLINLYIPDLCAQATIDRKLFAVVATAIYFHRASELEAHRFLPRDGSRHTQILGNDSLESTRFARLLHAWHLDRDSFLFTQHLLDRFRRFLLPPAHTLEQGVELTYTAAQQKLIESRPESKKIAGVAGSGKTYVLAKRAVNAHLRTHSNVLILTYNITLRNYIHDRISEVREGFEWKYFCITNYHCFFATQANRYELPRNFEGIENNDSSFSDEMFFEPASSKIERFDAIFIDEAQDYKLEWLRIIKRYFLQADGEFVLFGDEKQNLYGRLLDGKTIRTNIPGPFTKLSQSHRLNSLLADLATKFQSEFFGSRHDIDVVQSVRQESLFEPHVEYVNCEGSTDQDVAGIIFEHMNRWNIHPNDVAILCSRNEQVRQLDAIIRRDWHQRTTTCSETQEEFEALHRDNDADSAKPHIDKIRRSRRYNFWANAGTVKISTVHGFKGWECSAVFAIIERSCFDNSVSDELIYTAFTRCRDNLVLLNMGNSRYDSFFSQVIGRVEMAFHPKTLP